MVQALYLNFLLVKFSLKFLEERMKTELMFVPHPEGYGLGDKNKHEWKSTKHINNLFEKTCVLQFMNPP